MTIGTPANTFASNVKFMKANASGIHISRLVALKKIGRRATQIVKHINPTVLQIDAELSESPQFGEKVERGLVMFDEATKAVDKISAELLLGSNSVFFSCGSAAFITLDHLLVLASSGGTDTVALVFKKCTKNFFST